MLKLFQLPTHDKKAVGRLPEFCTIQVIKCLQGWTAKINPISFSRDQDFYALNFKKAMI